MLAEYATLRELRESSVRVGETRVTTFVTMLSAAILGVGILYQNTSNPTVANLVALAILTALMIIGGNIYVRVVEREIAVTQYTRGMNRLRDYFAQQYPTSLPYLTLPTTDQEPAFGGLGHFWHRGRRAAGLSGAVAMINCLLVGLAVGIAAAQLAVLDTPWQVGLAVFGVIAVAAAQVIYYWIRTKYHNQTYGPDMSDRSGGVTP